MTILGMHPDVAVAVVLGAGGLVWLMNSGKKPTPSAPTPNPKATDPMQLSILAKLIHILFSLSDPTFRADVFLLVGAFQKLIADATAAVPTPAPVAPVVPPVPAATLMAEAFHAPEPVAAAHAAV